MSTDKLTERRLTIKLEGEAVRTGRVSFSALSSKLAAAQNVLYNLALSKSQDVVASRGTWPDKIRAACELFLVETQSGSFTVVSELDRPTASIGELDLGVRAVHDLPVVIDAVNTNNRLILNELMPDSTGRIRTLKSLQQLCPREDEGFNVYIGNGASPARAELTFHTRRTINTYFEPRGEDFEYATRTLMGDLVEIRVKSGQRRIVVRNASREVECLYPISMEDEVSQLIAGSVVQVTGQVQLNTDGSIKQIDNVFDVSTVNLSPFAIGSFRWDGFRYNLIEPVTCYLNYRNDYWVYECPRYSLYTFSQDRSEALSQLHEEFSFLYDGLIDEENNNLSQDAINLRELLDADVFEVEEA